MTEEMSRKLIDVEAAIDYGLVKLFDAIKTYEKLRLDSDEITMLTRCYDRLHDEWAYLSTYRQARDVKRHENEKILEQLRINAEEKKKMKAGVLNVK